MSNQATLHYTRTGIQAISYCVWQTVFDGESRYAIQSQKEFDYKCVLGVIKLPRNLIWENQLGRRSQFTRNRKPMDKATKFLDNSGIFESQLPSK